MDDACLCSGQSVEENTNEHKYKFCTSWVCAATSAQWMTDKKPSASMVSQNKWTYENDLYYVNCYSKIPNDYTLRILICFSSASASPLPGVPLVLTLIHTNRLRQTYFPFYIASDNVQVSQFTYLRQVIVIIVRTSPSRDKPQPTYVIISKAWMCGSPGWVTCASEHLTLRKTALYKCAFNLKRSLIHVTFFLKERKTFHVLFLKETNKKANNNQSRR